MLPDTLTFALTETGAVVNIPRNHIHHSPDGFSWGYHGSGPADLALNILALALPNTAQHNTPGQLHEALQDETGEVPPENQERYLREVQNLPVQLFDGTFVSRQAYLLHQDFKRHFLANLPDWGGEIRRVTIEHWIAAQAVQPE